MNRFNMKRLIGALQYSIDHKVGLTVQQCPERVGFNMVTYGAYLVDRETYDPEHLLPEWQGYANPEFADFTKDKVNNCGTVACLSGWAGLLSGHQLGEARIDTLADFLEIPYGHAQHMALGEEWNEANGELLFDLSLRDITAEQALGMLKYYFDNQVVKWPRVDVT